MVETPSRPGDDEEEPDEGNSEDENEDDGEGDWEDEGGATASCRGARGRLRSRSLLVELERAIFARASTRRT